MKKTWLLLIAVILLLTLMVPGDTFASEPLSMKMMGYEPSSTGRVWAEHLFFERMEKITGLHFEFMQYQDEKVYHEAIAQLQKGETGLPDVFFKAAFLQDEMLDLYEKGILVDLRPYIKMDMPNFNALLEKDPALLLAISLPDGAIVSLPFITVPSAQNVLWINQTWLDGLKLAMPQTAEELQQVLRQFKTEDPNRNGRQDEIPLSFIGPYDLKYLAHAWGLSANDFNLFVQDGEVRFMPLQKEFRLFIRWCRELFQEGLLDPDGFVTVDALRRQTDQKAANRFGAFFAPLPSNLVPFEWINQYKVVPPLQFGGKAVYRTISGNVFSGVFAVSSGYADIDAALRWVDYLYSQDGAVLAGIGLEGVDYVFDGDGTWRLTRDLADKEYLSQVVIAEDHSAPGLSSDAFQRLYTDPLVRSVSEQVNLVAEVAKDPFPVFQLTALEREKIAPLQKALGRYVDESIARFVIGETETSDEAFQTFEQELNRLGLEEFLPFWQELYIGRVIDHGV